MRLLSFPCSAVLSLVSALLLSAPVCHAAADPAAFAPRDLKEVSPRDGLPRFFRKLEDGKAVRIGYLGGSITAQKGWRVQSRAWLQKQFPKAQIEEINAAIGGTGSDLGVFRVQSDVLDRKPDLLFVEFAVNDAGASPDRIRKAMEGIVRKTWRAVPDCDIAFVYTITKNDMAVLRTGKMKRSESVMEDVADHYGIPSIHLGVEVVRLEAEGKLVMASPDARVERPSGDELDVSSGIPTDAEGRILFSKDGVHPYLDTGHALYTQAIIRSIPAIRAAGGKSSQSSARTLPAPLVADNWENARMIPFGATPAAIGIRIDGPATLLDPATDARARSFASRLPGLWKLEPGATLRFRFRGTRAAVYDLLGPDCGALRVTIDGKTTGQRRFDGYCTYHRLGTTVLGDGLPDAEHTVEVTVLADAVDKKNVLFERNRDDFDKSPEKYVGSNWYAGALFLLGEPVGLE
ncbi:acyl-CoA thioesterase [Opitutaceae bacterium TAV5]|nr:acyl-CoA thioesterase [Opitutaceae bacterium TAV5]